MFVVITFWACGTNLDWRDLWWRVDCWSLYVSKGLEIYLCRWFSTGLSTLVFSYLCKLTYLHFSVRAFSNITTVLKVIQMFTIYTHIFVFWVILDWLSYVQLQFSICYLMLNLACFGWDCSFHSRIKGLYVGDNLLNANLVLEIRKKLLILAYFFYAHVFSWRLVPILNTFLILCNVQSLYGLTWYQHFIYGCFHCVVLMGHWTFTMICGRINKSHEADLL